MSMTTSRNRTVSLGAAAAGTVLLLTACGSGDGDETSAEGGDASGMTTISIGSLPIVPSAAFQVGIDEGIFAAHGIDLQLTMSQGGAATIPAVIAGDLDFATSNVISLLQARDQGLDVQIITHWSSGHVSGDDPIGLYVLADSDIESAADLEGRTVAVNTLNNLGDLTVRGAAREAGADDTLIEFVEMGFPDMPAALDSGQIDVAYVPEPFMTMIEDAGGVRISYPHMETHPGLPTQMVFTTAAYIADHPEIVAAMTDAINETLDLLSEDPDLIRPAAVDLLDLDPALAERVRIEDRGSDLRRDEIRVLADLVVEMGMIDGDPDVDGLMP